jgi:hypothetical protein
MYHGNESTPSAMLDPLLKAFRTFGHDPIFELSEADDTEYVDEADVESELIAITGEHANADPAQDSDVKREVLFAASLVMGGDSAAKQTDSTYTALATATEPTTSTA